MNPVNLSQDQFPTAAAAHGSVQLPTPEPPGPKRREETHPILPGVLPARVISAADIEACAGLEHHTVLPGEEQTIVNRAGHHILHQAAIDDLAELERYCAELGAFVFDPEVSESR